jgi:hypothetical protein
MPDFSAGLPSIPILVTAAVTVVTVVILWLRLRRRPSAEEIERRRRLAIQTGGKIGDGEIIDVTGNSLVYSYSVAGVNYTASQDATELRAMLPPDPMSLLGPISLKFDPRNPANSIVLCEQRSGLRTRDAHSLKPGA